MAGNTNFTPRAHASSFTISTSPTSELAVTPMDLDIAQSASAFDGDESDVADSTRMMEDETTSTMSYQPTPSENLATSPPEATEGRDTTPVISDPTDMMEVADTSAMSDQSTSFGNRAVLSSKATEGHTTTPLISDLTEGRTTTPLTSEATERYTTTPLVSDCTDMMEDEEMSVMSDESMSSDISEESPSEFAAEIDTAQLIADLGPAHVMGTEISSVTSGQPMLSKSSTELPLEATEQLLPAPLISDLAPPIEAKNSSVMSEPSETINLPTQSTAGATNEPIPTQTDLTTVESKVPEKMHHYGLRAFPPELRRTIFELCFDEDAEYTSKDQKPSLVRALKGEEYKDLRMEVWEAFLARVHVVMDVEIPVVFNETTRECETQSYTRILWFAPHFTLAKKLKLKYKNVDGPKKTHKIESRNCQQLQEDMAVFCNVTELTFDYTNLYPRFRYLTDGFNDVFVDVHSNIEYFEKLSKLSVVLPNARRPCLGPLDHWYPPFEQFLVHQFEVEAIPLIQAAFRTGPKLAHIRPCMLAEEEFDKEPAKEEETDKHPAKLVLAVFPIYETCEEGVVFHIYERCEEGTKVLDPDPEVVWFWTAEKGHTLQWDDEEIDKIWGEHRMVIKEFRGWRKSWADFRPEEVDNDSDDNSNNDSDDESDDNSGYDSDDSLPSDASSLDRFMAYIWSEEHPEPDYFGDDFEPDNYDPDDIDEDFQSENSDSDNFDEDSQHESSDSGDFGDDHESDNFEPDYSSYNFEADDSDPDNLGDEPEDSGPDDSEPGGFDDDSEPDDSEPNDAEPGDSEPGDSEPEDATDDTEPGDSDDHSKLSDSNVDSELGDSESRAELTREHDTAPRLDLADVLPDIPVKFHPFGLRVFPPEIRRMIFEYCFGDEEEFTEADGDNGPALAQALYTKDYKDDIWHECLAVWGEKVTVVVDVDLTLNEYEDKEYGTQFRLNQLWNTSLVPDYMRPLVKKLKLKFRGEANYEDEDEDELEDCEPNEQIKEEDKDEDEIPKGDTVKAEFENCEPKEPVKDEGENEHETNEFDPYAMYCNVKELTLDFKDASVDFHDAYEGSDDFAESVIRRCADNLKNLTKLSIAHSYATKYNNLAHPPRKPQETSWYFVNHRGPLFRFENVCIPLMEAAFGLPPKLTHVQTTSHCIEARYKDWSSHSLYPPPIPVLLDCFSPYIYEWTNEHKGEVVWFWKAEKGQTLNWNDGAFEKKGLDMYNDGIMRAALPSWRGSTHYIQQSWLLIH